MKDKTYMNDNERKPKSETRPFEALVMPRWMKQPHLFANGNFKLKYEDATGSYVEPFTFRSAVKQKKWLEGKNTYGKISLVARQITDMTDKEKQKWKSFIYEKSDTMIPVYANQTAYLLSIGVYPFDQKDFDSEHLIDARAV